MKIKTFLILTLFISFNYTVYSEDKKDIVPKDIVPIKLFDEYYTILQNYIKSVEETSEIREELYKLVPRNQFRLNLDGPKSQNYINYDNVKEICKELDDLISISNNVLVCLSYEPIIYLERISNKNLNALQKTNRVYFIDSLVTHLSFAVIGIKNLRTRIQNTTAVIAINKNLELLTKIKQWVLINKNKPVLNSLQ